MSSFTSPLIVSPTQDRQTWKLARQFSYHIGSKYSRNYIRVPEGFETDFASIPKILIWTFPWWAKFSKPSIVHDWLYNRHQIMSDWIKRKEADDVFLEAMLVDFRNHKSGKLVAYLEYFAVRIFGFLAWKR